MSLYLPNRSKYGVASAPGTSTMITLGTLVPSFLPLPNEASGFPVVYYAEDTIAGAAVVEIGDATLTQSGGTWTLTNRNPTEQSNGSASLLSLTSAALIGFSFRAGDLFGFSGGYVNKFRNPVFDIWQRGVSLTITTSGGYTADGWVVSPTGASVGVTLDTTRSNDGNFRAIRIAGAASVAQIQLQQRIESSIATPLAGKTCTVRYKVFNGKASGTLTPLLQIYHPNAVDNFGAVTQDLSVNMQVCVNGAWTDIAYTFTANTSLNGMLVALFFGALGAGDFVEVTAADIRETPFMAVGLCATPQRVEWRPISTEFNFCQRYFFSTFPNGTTPGTSGVFTESESLFVFTGPTANLSSFLGPTLVYPNQLRITGAVTIYNPHTGAIGSAWAQNGLASLTAAAVSNSPVSITLGLSNMSVAANDFVKFMFTASAEL